MNMFSIGDFFKKIRNCYTKELLVRSKIKEAVKKHAGADVPIEAISFRAGAAILNRVSHAVRSAVFVKKQAILEEVARSQDLRPISDIR